MRKLYLALFILLFCHLRIIAQKVISPSIRKPVSTFISPASPQIRITAPKIPVIGVFGSQGIPLLMTGSDGGGSGPPPPGCSVQTGVISGGGVSVCVGTNSTTLTLINSQFADTYQWESSTDNSHFTNIDGATSTSYTATNLTTNTYFFVNVSSSTRLCGGSTPPVEISMIAGVAGTIEGGGVTVCPGVNSTALTVTGYTPGSTLQWQSFDPTDEVGSLQDIPSAAGPAYNAVNLSSTTAYRVKVSDDCATPAVSFTEAVEIIVAPSATWVLDADNDGYYVGSPVTQCGSPGTGWVSLTNQQPGDCNDQDATVHAAITYYRDADGDSYGDPNNTTSVCSSTPPTGYVSNNLDCDDTNVALNPNTQWVLDADGDHYYVGNIITQCVSPGPGYVSVFYPFGFPPLVRYSDGFPEIPGDCNDNDPNVNATFSFYIDNDHDGYGAGPLVNGICAVDANTPPLGYSTNNTDCDDTNPNVHTAFSFYRDMDGDGYGAGTLITGICAVDANTPPPGYSTNNTDANDMDASVWQYVIIWQDLDGDGYSSVSGTFFYGATLTIPAGYSLTTNGPDCDDSNPKVHATFSFYIDNDHDGYGTGNLISNICAVDANTPPLGYSTNNTDCDDTNPNVHATFSFYRDNDGDGYGAGPLITGICAVDANTPPPGYSTNNTDCDDGDPNAWQSVTIWQDFDGDGYSSISVAFCTNPGFSNMPSGYSLTTKGPDCDDNDPNVHATFSFYIDNDHDGYGTGNLIPNICAVDANTPPPGYSTSNTDCDDTNPNVHTTFSFYRDNDGDGYGAGPLITGICAVDANTPPVGYSTNNSDCNDNDPNVHATFSFYVDHDNDGYGSGSLINGICALNASTPPIGYSTNNTDCNDNDPTVWQSRTLYIDKDGDGYTAGTATVCYGATVPSGYSLTSKGPDCNDNDPNSHLASVPGTISGAASVCPITNSTLLTLSGNMGTIQWQSSLNNTAFTSITGAQGLTYTATNLSTTTYYRAMVSNGSCPSVNSPTVAISMGNLQNATSSSTTNITTISATLNWTSSFNPAQWQIEYKSTTPGSKWIDPLPVNGSTRSLLISNLNCNQSYQWHIRDNCGKTWTDYSTAITFKTLACTSGAAMNQAVNIPETTLELQVRAMPNPTNTNFTITVKGNIQSGMIKMVVVDMYGRMMEERMLPNEQTISLGDSYRPGLYLVKLIQGEQSKELKLIKLPN